jgi:hypothetical protein
LPEQSLFFALNFLSVVGTELRPTRTAPARFFINSCFWNLSGKILSEDLAGLKKFGHFLTWKRDFVAFFQQQIRGSEQ